MGNSEHIGSLQDQTIYSYSIGHPDALVVQIMNYGSTITHIHMPDQDGKIIDIALGYDNLSSYITDSNYLGSTVGRYANRIAYGTFTIDNMRYSVTPNIPPHHLHGGTSGFNSAIWDVVEHSANSITLSYLSKDMEEGYPGNLQIMVTFEVNEYSLSISYAATTDQCTPINVTNHTYFNLNGAGNNHILNHQLEVYASTITDVDGKLIPTGGVIPIQGTPFDFTSLKTIDSVVNENGINGLDHNFILDQHNGNLQPAAKLYSGISGIEMEVFTTEPGLQIYTGNGLDDMTGKKGYTYPQYGGICLETQHFPDSPNHPHFPSTLLYPDQKFNSKTEYRFSIRM